MRNGETHLFPGFDRNTKCHYRLCVVLTGCLGCLRAGNALKASSHEKKKKNSPCRLTTTVWLEDCFKMFHAHVWLFFSWLLHLYWRWVCTCQILKLKLLVQRHTPLHTPATNGSLPQSPVLMHTGETQWISSTVSETVIQVNGRKWHGSDQMFTELLMSLL